MADCSNVPLISDINRFKCNLDVVENIVNSAQSSISDCDGDTRITLEGWNQQFQAALDALAFQLEPLREGPVDLSSLIGGVFNFAEIQYLPGKNQVWVFVNGNKLELGSDYTESSSTSITLTADYLAAPTVSATDRIEVWTVDLLPNNSIKAEGVSFDDAVAQLGAVNVQDAIEKLSAGAGSPTGVYGSFAAMLSADLTGKTRVNTTGYYADTQGIGAGTYIKSALTGTPGDTDGGSYFIGLDGSRWQLEERGKVNFTQFGAKPTDELPQGTPYPVNYQLNWQAMLNYCSESGVEARIDPYVFPVLNATLPDCKTLTIVGSFGKSKLILAELTENTNILQITTGSRFYAGGVTFDGNQGGMGPSVGGGLVQINDSADNGLISFLHRCTIKSARISTTSNGLATTGDLHIHGVSECYFTDTRSSGWYPQSFFSTAYKCVWDGCRTGVSFVNTKHLEIVSSKFVNTEVRDLLSFSQSSSKSAAERLILRDNEFDRRGNTDPVSLEIAKRNMRSPAEEFGVGSKYGVTIVGNKFQFTGTGTDVNYFMILGSSDSSDPNFDGYTLQDVLVEGNEFNGIRPARVYRTNNLKFRNNKILNTTVGMRLENGCANITVADNELTSFDATGRMLDFVAGASYAGVELGKNKYINCLYPYQFQGGNPAAMTGCSLMIPKSGTSAPMPDKSHVIWWDTIDNVKKVTVDAPADGYVIDFVALGNPDYLILKPAGDIALGNPAGAFELYDYQNRFIVNDSAFTITIGNQGAGGFETPGAGTVILLPGQVLEVTNPDTSLSANATYAVVGAQTVCMGQRFVGDFSSNSATISDMGKVVVFTRSSTAITFNGPGVVPVGWYCYYVNAGTQSGTFVPSVGVLINSGTLAANTLKKIVKITATQWVVA